MPLPPGPLYLWSFVPRITLFVSVTYLALKVCARISGARLPPWAVVTLCILSRPVGFLAWRLSKPQRDARAAAAMGARLLPRVPASFTSIVSRLLETTKNGYPAQGFHEFTKMTGPACMFTLVSQDMVFTMEPEHLKTILATRTEDFPKGPVFQHQLTSLLGVGIFNVEGDLWKYHRSMTRPFFNKERVGNFDIWDRTCSKALDLARERLAEGYSLDFQDLVARFTLDSATQFLCGQDVCTLGAGIPYPRSATHKTPKSFLEHPSYRILRAFNDSMLYSVARSTMGEDWPLAEFWGDKVIPMREIIDDFFKPLLQQAVARKEEYSRLGIDDDEGGCLLDHLVKETQDPLVLKDEMFNLLLAGRDTLASLLSSMVYMLAEHPDVEQRLREDVLEHIGSTAQPTYAQMRSMKYTRAFINEVLRLYPPNHLDNRTANKPCLLPSESGAPYYVPEGAFCVYSVTFLHRRTDLWGPDASIFDPMRFLDERLHKYLNPNPYIFLPFNAGPRICLGQDFAYHQATFFLIRLLQNFTEFELDLKENLPPNPEWKQTNDRRSMEKLYITAHATTHVKGGLWIKMKPYPSPQ